MRILHPRYFILGLVMALVALLADQASKWYLIDIVGIEHRTPLAVTSFFNLVMVWNHGISFGMFAGRNQPLMLELLSAAIICMLLNWLRKNPSLLVALALGNVIGGALGNVIDRVRFSAVADFFDMHIDNLSWPAFNVADSTIFIGVVLLCVHSMLSERSTPEGTTP